MVRSIIIGPFFINPDFGINKLIRVSIRIDPVFLLMSRNATTSTLHLMLSDLYRVICELKVIYVSTFEVSSV